MSTFDETYLALITRIINEGVKKPNRTGFDTFSVFNGLVETPELGFNNLPISHTRKIYYHGAIIEALWLLGIHQNDKQYRKIPFTNTKYLTDNKVNYWKPWQDEEGNLGPVYGEQLCRWKKYEDTGIVMDESDRSPKVERINQVERIIETLRNDKYSRRLVCSMWNPAEIDKMALPPCHYCFEFYVRPSEGHDILDIRWIQRSADMLIGIPYNVLQYSIVLQIVALCTGLKPGRVIGCLGDCHVYEDQMPYAKWILGNCKLETFSKMNATNNGLTQLNINQKLLDKWESGEYPNLSDFNPDGSDFEVVDYKSLEKISIFVAV